MELQLFNLLFSVAVSGTIIGLLFLIKHIMISLYESAQQEKVSPVVKRSFNGGLLLLFVLLVWNGYSTYGPRITIQDTPCQEYRPEAQDIDPSDPWIDPKDRFGKFDKRIESEKVEDLSEKQ